MLDEPQVVLELPGSIVVRKKGFSHSLSSKVDDYITRVLFFYDESVLFSLFQSKKGKSPTTQRELSVVMPNGQSILVKCEVKSRGGDVFDMIAAHSNLVEHFYFGLAYTDGI